MNRNTRTDILSESDSTFSEIRRRLGGNELEDLVVKEKLSDIVFERYREGGLTEFEKDGLWQFATNEDIEQLAEIYSNRVKAAGTEELIDAYEEFTIGQNIGSSSATATQVATDTIPEGIIRDADTDSNDSNESIFIITPSYIDELCQTLGLGSNDVDVDTGTLTTGKTQERYISAHILILEIFKSRLRGVDVEDAIEIIPQIVGEYIREDSDGMKEFLAYLKEEQDSLALQGVLTKAERKRIFELENHLFESLKEGASKLEQFMNTEEGQGIGNENLSFLTQKLARDKAIIAQFEAKYAIISPTDQMKLFKEADLQKNWNCFLNMLKAAVVTIGNMDMISFKEEEAAVNRGSQLLEKGYEAVTRLRDKKNWKSENYNQVSEDILTLFDYPKREIDALPKDEIDMTAPSIVNKLFNRHIKLIYDSFEGFRNTDDIFMIISRTFDAFVRNQGWSTETEQYSYPNSHENIDANSRSFILPEKFDAAKSRNLIAEMKELEVLY